MKRSNGHGRGWKIAGFCVCAAVFLLSGAMLLYDGLISKKEESAFDELAAIVAQAQAPTLKPMESAPPQEQLVPNEAAPAPSPNPQYEALQAMNGDFYGWIKIDGTAIDYPVMWTPKEPEYYLYRAFDGTQSKSGVPFLGEGFAPGTPNAIVYGHHMKNGTMFAGLLAYEDKDFFSLHPTVLFNTLYENAEYEIIAAFRSRIYTADETGVFRYYWYYDIQTEQEFNEYVTGCKAASIYDTGVNAEWGDSILTLSTCGYHAQNGRFVVVARKLEHDKTEE